MVAFTAPRHVTAPRLFVSPEAGLAELVCALNDYELVSFGSPTRPSQKPAGLCSNRFHPFRFNDIAEPREDLIAPAKVDVERLLALVQRSSASCLVFQCWFGVSRSTAACLLAAAALKLGTPDDLCRRLRSFAPWATPNPMLIALGDDALGMGGALSSAVHAIGRGTLASGGQAFEFSS